MKKLLLISMLICAFLWIVLSMNQLYAQEMTELTVPDYSYGEVWGGYGLVTDEGRPYPGKYGASSSGTDERASGLFLAHGYRWWGYPSLPLFICTDLPEFNYPGNHGVWSPGMVMCTMINNGHEGSWGGVITEPDSQTIWCLGGAMNENGPTAPYIANEVNYGIPSHWGSVNSYGYLRKIVQVQSTGTLQDGDPVDIMASLESEGVIEGDGTATVMGFLFLTNLSEGIWVFEFGKEYLDYGFISEMETDHMLGDLEINLNSSDNISATVAVGDILMVEIAYRNRLVLDNPGAFGEMEGWVGERPIHLYPDLTYTRTDSIKSLIKKHGNTLTYDLISLTTGAVLEPVTPDGPNMDGDIDGISDVQEKGPDGNDDSFDGNTDGIPDFEQADVSSFHTFDGQNYVTMVVPEGTELSQLIVTDNPSPSDVPEGTEFNYGFFDFSIDGLDPGEAITVTLILHNGVPVDKYYKYGKTPADDPVAHWYEFMYDGQTGAEINGNVIDLHFVDGLRGDEDITINGSIKEPGGPSKSVITGMSEFIETKGNIVVYPNPSTNYITLKTNNIKPSDDYILKIYSITGKIIKEEKLNIPDASYQYTIPTANYPNGIYMITLSGNNITYKTKFVIKN